MVYLPTNAQNMQEEDLASIFKVEARRISLTMPESGLQLDDLQVFDKIKPPPVLDIANTCMEPALCSVIGVWAGTSVETLSVGSSAARSIAYEDRLGLEDVIPYFKNVRHLHLREMKQSIASLPVSMETLHLYRWPQSHDDTIFLRLLHRYVHERTSGRSLEIRLYRSILEDSQPKTDLTWTEADIEMARDLDMGAKGEEGTPRCETGGRLEETLRRLHASLQ